MQPLPRCPAPLRGHEYWLMRLRKCGKETTPCRLQNKLTTWHSIPHLPLSLFNLIEIILHVPLPDSPSPRRPRSHDATCAPRCQVPVTLRLVRPPPPFIFHKIFRCVSAVPPQPSHRLQVLVRYFGLCESRKGPVRTVAKTQVPSIFRRTTAKEIDFC